MTILSLLGIVFIYFFIRNFFVYRVQTHIIDKAAERCCKPIAQKAYTQACFENYLSQYPTYDQMMFQFWKWRYY